MLGCIIDNVGFFLEECFALKRRKMVFHSMIPLFLNDTMLLKY